MKEFEKDIEAAFKKCDDIGLTAFLELGNFKYPAQYWIEGKNGKLYPSKACYGYIHNVKSSDCHGNVAWKWFAKSGYKIIKIDKDIASELNTKVNKLFVEKSLEELEDLANAGGRKNPIARAVTIIKYNRSAAVIAYSLKRADGFCEECKSKAPFNRRNDGTPYLEVHHKIPLSDGGEDTIENTIAICPNCHAEAHFGHIK